MNSKIGPLVILVVVIAAVVIAAFWRPTLFSGLLKKNTDISSMTLTSEQKYLCDGGKTITAKFYQGTQGKAGTPDTPPVPDGKAVLTLAGGTSIELTQTISADGVRYANANESFVFWTRGPGALVLQDNQESTEYKNCFIGA